MYCILVNSESGSEGYVSQDHKHEVMNLFQVTNLMHTSFIL